MAAARRRAPSRSPDHGDRPAHEQLPGAGVGAEIGPIGSVEMVRHPHPDGRRRRQGQGGADQDSARPPATAHHEEDAGDQQWPDEVVLLLYGQGPGVLERAHGGELGEVAVAGGDLLPVGDVEQGGQGGRAQLGRDEPGTAHQCVDGQHDQQQQHGWQQTPGPASPEGQHVPRWPFPGQQQAGDQVPRQDEEDVHSQPAPVEVAEVERHHQGDGDGADAVQLGLVPSQRHVRRLTCARASGRPGPCAVSPPLQPVSASGLPGDLSPS